MVGIWPNIHTKQIFFKRQITVLFPNKISWCEAEHQIPHSCSGCIWPVPGIGHFLGQEFWEQPGYMGTPRSRLETFRVDWAIPIAFSRSLPISIMSTTGFCHKHMLNRKISNKYLVSMHLSHVFFSPCLVSRPENIPKIAKIVGWR